MTTRRNPVMQLINWIEQILQVEHTILGPWNIHQIHQVLVTEERAWQILKSTDFSGHISLITCQIKIPWPPPKSVDYLEETHSGMTLGSKCIFKMKLKGGRITNYVEINKGRITLNVFTTKEETWENEAIRYLRN